MTLTRVMMEEYGLLLKAFEERGPMSHREAQFELGVTPRNTRNWLNELHRRGDIHIVTWSLNKRGPMYPVFAAGSGEDAVKPKRPTPTERKKQKRQDALYWLNDLANKRRLRKEKRACQQRS
jgi:hypothetical protein